LRRHDRAAETESGPVYPPDLAAVNRGDGEQACFSQGGSRITGFLENTVMNPLSLFAASALEPSQER
jgi:hypothetical protein